jgi:O-antigen ligase
MQMSSITDREEPASADVDRTRDIIVYIFGALDSLVPFAYFLNIYSNTWHAVTLVIKFILCLVFYKYVEISKISKLSAYVLTFIILVSSVPGGSVLSDYVRIFGFMIHVFITLAIVRRVNLKQYILTCTVVLFVSTLLYLVAVETGQVGDTFGRYSYFHGSHPNLGSEIIAMSVVLAACVLSWLPFIVLSVPSLYAIHLMQGRAALLVALIAIFSKFYFSERSKNARLILLVVLLVSGLSAVLFWSGTAYNYLNSIFLLHDKYRGMNTGFTGRDRLWGTAWEYFLKSPIIGNGAGFFDRYGVAVHNFFLFGLSEFGILSLLIYGMIFFLFYDLYRTNRTWFYSFIGIPIFWIFNDRFLNINPYPFLFYIVLFAHANTYKERAVARAVERPKSATPGQDDIDRRVDCQCESSTVRDATESKSRSCALAV